MDLNLSLYLVTDSTRAILGDRDLAQVVDDAIKGGVTIVQYREKVADTGTMVATAKKLHQITQKHGVPLLINDRVDVALAVGAEGVHLGQDDMDLQTARMLMGDKAIIGISANNANEAHIATEGGADYLGIGAVFATPTKEDTKSILGTTGVREILTSLSAGRKIRTVAIAGINKTNIQRVVYQSKARFKGLDGVAVVSAIMAAEKPYDAARQLKELLDKPCQFSPVQGAPKLKDLNALIQSVPRIVRRHLEASPLCHNMTNLVVQNFAANVCIASGASPIMSNNGEEGEDLAKLEGAFVINMGTVTPEMLKNYLQALKTYNLAGCPVVFDPVGGGATKARRSAIKTLMAGGFFDVIKGNEGEISAVMGDNLMQQKGVDASASNTTPKEKAAIVKALAQRERNIILMTGATDYLSDGDRVFAISNGHHLLGQITGSGCALGTVIASFLAAHREDKLLAALSAILYYEIAAEKAASRDYCHGPGSFVPAFIDELFAIRGQAQNNLDDWVLKGAKVEIAQV